MYELDIVDPQKTKVVKTFSWVDLEKNRIHGSGNKGNLNLLYNVVRKGIPRPLGRLKTNELISVICESLGSLARIWYFPKVLMHKLAALDTVLKLPLNSKRLQKLTKNYVVSISKIKKALGIERMPVSAKEGLFRTLKSFKD